MSAEDKTWAESKGWKPDTSPAIIADSYKNLEKLFGADKAGRTVLLPKDATDTAAADAIFTKLGKPADVSGYEISLPDGADPTFANTAKEVFLKNNLTATQAKGVTDWYRAMELDKQQADEKFVKDEETALRTEWGDKFDTNRETARAATKAAGMTDEDVEKMVGAIGPAKASKVLEFFGRNYVEAGPPGEAGRGAPGFSNVTPASAQQRIDQLWTDPNFMQRYNNPDPKIREGAMTEMDNLSKVAVNAKRG